MKTFFALLVIFWGLLTNVAYAQSVSPLRFESLEHDFGTIAEDGGQVKHAFRFENTSDRAVVIVATSSSCGCTKAEFSRKPVQPHEKGEIVVRFSPMNYPGTFARKVRVTTSEGRLAEPLLIKGNVTPRKLSIAEQYPIHLGEGIRIDANSHSFGYAEHGKRTASSFAVINDSDRTVGLRIKPCGESGHLTISAPATLAPHERAEINFGYALPETCTVYGRMTDTASIYINDTESDIALVINAIAIDNRDNFADTEEPRIVLSENFIKFGSLKGGNRTAVQTIVVTNTGASPLVLRSISSERGIVEGQIMGSTEIAVGESSRLKVILTAPAGKYGAVTDRLTIVSNDPQSPARILKVTAIVEK